MTAGSSIERSSPPCLSRFQKFTFLMGNLGWSLASYGVANLLNYFYVPNVQDGRLMFPLYISTEAIFLGLTVLGLIASGGRLFDAVTDPLIAGFSDRSRRRIGKRRWFMAVSAAPLGLFSLLVFVPIGGTSPQGVMVSGQAAGESAAGAIGAGPAAGAIGVGPAGSGSVGVVGSAHLLNITALAVTLFVFYLFFTMYMVPISAWVSELGHTSDERLDMATLSSVGWALGFGIGNAVYALQSWFEGAGLGSVGAFQAALAIFAVTATVAMYLPVLFIDEPRYTKPVNTKEGPMQAARKTLTDRNFRAFLGSQVMYWIALTFIQVGIAYFVVTLLKIDKSWASFAMTLLFAASFLFYVPINRAAKRVGKKRLLVFAFLELSAVYAVATFLGLYPIPPVAQVVAIAILAALPIGIFTIIPFAMIADMAEAEGRSSGNYKAGMYYAMRGLVMKGGIAVANLLFPTIVLWGSTEVNATGVRATAVFALLVSLVGTVIVRRGYDERSIGAALGQPGSI